MRRGETFDACVPLLYKFVGERYRTVVEDIKERSHFQRQEEVVFDALEDSGLLDETNLPPNISLRVELVHTE
eukprot:7531729-Alexandrium_andersonii.AAC.1